MKFFIFSMVRLLFALSLVLTMVVPTNAQETSKELYDRIVAIDEKTTSALMAKG